MNRIRINEFKGIGIDTLAEAFNLHAREECETKLVCKNKYGGEHYNVLMPTVISNLLNKKDLWDIFEGLSEEKKNILEDELINLEL